MTVFDDNLQGSCAIVFIIFTPICLIATGLRFVASRVALGKIGLEDWLALAALSFYLVWIVASSFGKDPSPCSTHIRSVYTNMNAQLLTTWVEKMLPRWNFPISPTLCGYVCATENCWRVRFVKTDIYL